MKVPAKEFAAPRDVASLELLSILALMFEQTKSMFARWLQYGIGTMFSLAVLIFTVTVAMKMVGAVAANFAAQYMTMMALGAGDSPGVNTVALQQGGLGMFLTVLILSVPPMASSFFQGVLGSFTPQSIFGANAGARSDTSAGAGQGGYRPPETPPPPNSAERSVGLSRKSRSSVWKWLRKTRSFENKHP